jgi:hypothetical protein
LGLFGDVQRGLLGVRAQRIIRFLPCPARRVFRRHLARHDRLDTILYSVIALSGTFKARESYD